jgi:type I restriction enzyme M protein
MPKLSLAKLERHLYSAADRLRQEGLDAATYKDYIFGMLFLKRSSDVFDAEREKIVGTRLEQGMAQEKAEGYGEDPDYYDGFFVPERARWAYLQDRLGDAKEPYGSVLDKALGALAEHNDTLEHVLDHISFMRVQSNKRIVSDDACKDLVRHFSRYRLRNEDFQFSDLLGSAYEFLINMFAESAGKKGGDFYTPRDVIRLMVRILRPKPGLSVYDPCCGSGGMLIISREFIEQSGGDPTNIRLCGQVNDTSAWSICKLNMLLHGVPGADIQLQDTLLHPMHREAGELERFDRVIANPPFSQNYTKSNMEFPERFRWGWAPTTGKKGDFMFAQHMLAVCKPGGMVTTVMPHGVLFRGGAEKEIRKKFLEQDLIEAIIGLPPNLFYGAGIPACILVMRPNLTGHSPNPSKPENRRGHIFFINADAEFHAGRAQNYLRPEHIEKIVSTYDRYQDEPGYSRRVPLEEISSPANDWNLNIRRYVDNSPPPEPHDVRAHLLGGVPVAEVETQRTLFESLSFDPAHIFVPHSNTPSPPQAYFDFAPSLTDRSAIRPLIDNDPGVQARVKSLRDALASWWNEHSARLADLPARRDLNAVRAEFLDSFVTALSPLNVLDRFKLAGVIAAWWTETLPDFKTLMENGFGGVIDGWVDSIADAVEDDEAAGPIFDPFAHRLVRRVMSDYLDQIAAAKTDVARLKGEKEVFEQSNEPDDLDDEELKNWNYAKDLERQIRELKVENRDALKEIANAEKAAARNPSSKRKPPPLTGGGKVEGVCLQTAKASLQPALDQIAALETTLAPYEQIKHDLASARARFRKLTDEFVSELKNRCGFMGEDRKRGIVLELFAKDVQTGLDAAVSDKRQELTRAVEAMWDKYAEPLQRLSQTRTEIIKELDRVMSRLGYI